MFLMDFLPIPLLRILINSTSNWFSWLGLINNLTNKITQEFINIMVDTSTKGQASPRSHFFHVTFHQSDKKWYALEVHDGKRNAFNTEKEALDQVRK